MRIKLEKKQTQQTWIEGWNWKQPEPWQKGQEKILEIKRRIINLKILYMTN
jgi:hypothetical protein